MQGVIGRLRGKGRLDERDVDEALREVRLALLEADVSFRVVRDLIASIRERAVGEEVLRSLTPGQQVIKIVHDELVRLMGGAKAGLVVAPKPPTIVMLVGLQGSGKTTTCAKLAAHLRKQGRRPLLVAADVHRPAAVDQLEALGRQLDIPVHTPSNHDRSGRLGGGAGTDPLPVVRAGIEAANRLARDYIIVDTAGRLHVDADLMGELKRLKQGISPHETIIVVDAMTGQDAVNVAEQFEQQVGIDGIILTKLDGDARGGAALSVRAVTNRPIKFIGVGEKMDALEPFHPDRLASRILGMGDVLSLVEKAQEAFDADKARDLEKKLKNQQLTLDDFLDQLRQVRRMGPLQDLLGMLPGVGSFKQLKDVQVDERQLARTEAIIHSMTREERRRPEIVDGSRRRRIARGSGTSVQDVNKLLREFANIRKLFKNAGPMRKGRGGFGWR